MRLAQSMQRLLGRGKLAGLLEQSAQHSQLEHVLQAVLDPQLHGHCHVGSIHKNELVLIVANSAWATRFYYAKTELLKALAIHPEFRDIKKIKIRIAKQREGVVQPRIRRAIPISDVSKQTIIATAHGVKDKELRNALLKLAK